MAIFFSYFLLLLKVLIWVESTNLTVVIWKFFLPENCFLKVFISHFIFWLGGYCLFWKRKRAAGPSETALFKGDGLLSGKRKWSQNITHPPVFTIVMSLFRCACLSTWSFLFILYSQSDPQIIESSHCSEGPLDGQIGNKWHDHPLKTMPTFIKKKNCGKYILEL